VSPPSDQDNRARHHDRSTTGAPTQPPTDTVTVVLPAEWVAPSIARDRVRQWLITHHWSPAHREDLVLAISEAVSNSVEHGYRIHSETDHTTLSPPPGSIELHGQLITDPAGTRRVEFTIRDHGHWMPPTPSHGRRGHGMTIMRACTDEITIDHTAAGTTLVLRSRPLPKPPQ
jgi:serine/threonine-protein kinase RsbW